MTGSTSQPALSARLAPLSAAQLRALIVNASEASPLARAAIEQASLAAIKAAETEPPPAPRAFLPLAKARSTAPDGRSDAIVVVDPLSSGATLADLAQKRGFLIVRVLSRAFSDELMACLPAGCSALRWHATVAWDADHPEKAVEALRGLDCHLLGILVGCECGVECHDALTTAFGGFPSNGVERSLTRRDKHPMGEAVRTAGLRAVKQKLCATWAEAEAFCVELGLRNEGARCVLKPCKSAGTDGVYMVDSLIECRQRFDEIASSENVFGEDNAAVLVQEFMRGTEYVVDSVSVEGVHKCVAIWRYDKRPCNGAGFVYFAMELFQSDGGDREEALVDYVHQVLDALGCRHGPSHAEVMWLDGDDEPCLVEVGCRPHGGEGTFVDMVQPIMGHSQLSVMLDAVERPYRFHRLPKRPPRFSGGAFEVCLVAHEAGTLKGLPGLDAIRALPSYLSEEIKIEVGQPMPLTVDFLTTPGSIMLYSKDAAQLKKDFETIHALCKQGLFVTLPPNRLRLKSL
mmetsp:Transcript_11395/g.35088  ORF Transcript_11395/g.35088 Transcript_11395/m.35088 type:complete len:516 (-) Transcript_11395:71-1618(-)